MHNQPSVMRSLKDLSYEEQEVGFSKGNTYQDNGLVLKHVITKMKIDQIARLFNKKMRRNLLSAEPVDFKLHSEAEAD